MRLRSLLITVAVAVGSLFTGMLLALVLHLAGMPVPLIVVTVVLIASTAVLLDWLRNRAKVADDEDEAADAEEVSA